VPVRGVDGVDLAVVATVGFTSLQGIADGGTVSVDCANNPFGQGYFIGTLGHVSLIAIQVEAVH
jgi:hypothetical protein